jgi:hypothetical protein
MQRISALGAIFIATLTCAAASAFAAGTTVVNDSQVDIDHLYTAAPGSDSWSKDLLAGTPDAVLDAGHTYNVDRLEAGTYDLRLEDDEGNTAPCVLKAVEVKPDATLTLTQEMAAACK